ncbi:hypothetical protein [Allobranchiibius sp. GilTou38]|uniref:hypothetical protein n=1 Tax=Allobranchiibius sp. GilTou38 TaxID=2815210 RepID=UPI001AA0DFD2|nr:hypothetical protein [Allobranchiibius sp. GilTou38]MBO1768336.1 hypothetical protein [Allobranchiibius sp. GilTou38]
MTSDADRTPDHAAARRAVARRLHPDLGGDSQEYVAAMAELDHRLGVTAAAPHAAGQGPVPDIVRHGRLSSVRGNTRRAARTMRRILPSGWPGSRRYGRL